VNRAAGQRGYCRAGVRPELYRYAPHHGEEPPLAGTRGSGTLFFSRCTLRCRYCQNYPWSQEGAGEELDTAGLASALRGLRDQGCHNWNLVSPTPWLPAIVEALATFPVGERLPVVYNTSGFERPETVRALDRTVDLFLTDLRYSRAETAAAASDSADYAAVAREACLAMWRQVGPLRLDAAGVATRGLICRVLILPGHAGEAVENLQWLAETLGPSVAVSVMAQYTPAYRALREVPWNRPITREEYDRVRDAVEALGFEEGWVQDFGGETESALLGFAMQAGPGGVPEATGEEGKTSC